MWGVSMIYEILNNYRAYLNETLSAETARTYTDRLGALLEGQSIINTMENFDMNLVLENLSKVKYKNYFSQSKNALLYFLKFQKLSLGGEQLQKIKKLQNNTHKKYRKLKSQDYKVIKRKIEHLKNQKLKLCYQVLMATGLRVSELSQIKTNDCVVLNNCFIQLSFVGKGGKAQTIAISKDENTKLYNTLKNTLETTKLNEKLFYSSNYLQIKAKELGFTCHDLRRICSKLEYKKVKSKEAVKEKLRHSNMKTTELYLNSKIKL